MKAFVLIVFLIPLLGWSAIPVDFIFNKNEVKQGEIVPVTLKVSPDGVSQLNLQKLRGVNFGKTIYFYELSSWIHQNGEPNMSSSAKIIFIDVPTTQVLKDTVNGQDIEINLNNIQVIPTAASQELLFGAFEIPARKEILKWTLIFLSVVGLAAIVWTIYQKYQIKKKRKLEMLKLKSEILSAQDYEGVVSIWQKKRKYLAVFPHLESPFQNLEVILFKYQFKPRQENFEKDEVVKAYQNFVAESQEGFRGI